MKEITHLFFIPAMQHPIYILYQIPRRQGLLVHIIGGTPDISLFYRLKIRQHSTFIQQFLYT